MKRYFKWMLLLLIGVALLGSCKKQYYFDTGQSIARFNGNMLQYFEANPELFDTLLQVIKIAKLEDYFRDSSLTFFAPADSSIMKTYYYINQNFRAAGMDTLKGLEDLKPEFWRNNLMLYMFQGVRGIEDFPQLDFSNLYSFSGEYATSVSGQVMNIGTVFTDARGLKYKGYRRLYLNYVPSEASPLQNWVQGPVASCNIQPTNGMIHVLIYYSHYFGFDPYQAWLQAKYYSSVH